MTYSQAEDGLSSRDMQTRMDAAEFFLKRPLEPAQRKAIVRLFNDAWEAHHSSQKEEAA